MHKPSNPRRSLVWMRLFQVIFTLCTIGTILFIFQNSLEIAQLSGARSTAVTQWLNGLMESLGREFRFTHTQVRKLAHFAEYALLGFWMMITLRVYTRRIFVHIFFPLFVGLAVPVADESIQLLTPGRVGQVKDILIDFAGSLTGIACGAVLLLLAGMVFAFFRKREPR